MNRHTKLISRLLAERRLSEMDYHFARFLLSKAEQPSSTLAMAAALVCRATAEGHVCLDLRSDLGHVWPLQATEMSDLLLPLADWREALLNSGVVGKAGDYQPLILDAAGRLYLHRYWDYEQRLARDLLQRARLRIDAMDSQQLSAKLDELFPPLEQDAVDWQKLAAAIAVLRGLSVISGGPGTGKTTAVIKILALLRQQPSGESLRIALAAPTGKAAARMQEAVRRAKCSLGLPTALLESIPEQASTLHRLLGVRHGEIGFRHHADNPLALDVLILDEASMIDVALMVKMLAALPQTARLILLGDKDQLASVEAGAVLGDICSGCKGPSPTFAAELRSICGENPSGEVDTQPSGICDSIMVLRHSYRFGADSAIGRLAFAVNQGEAEIALSLLANREAGNETSRLLDGVDIAAYAAERYHSLFELVDSGVSVAELFTELNRFRVLCALRQGPAGSIRLNQLIADRLQRQARIPADAEWYPGRPIMVTRNDYQLKLYNGDLGITLPDPQRDGELGVVFQEEEGDQRWLAPSRLPTHESMFAMTVHKSQGSEFDEVLLLLPGQDAPVLSRELLYTAITRSRQRFGLSATPAVFQLAVNRRLKRNSGLPDLLRERSSFLTT